MVWHVLLKVATVELGSPLRSALHLWLECALEASGSHMRMKGKLLDISTCPQLTTDDNSSRKSVLNTGEVDVPHMLAAMKVQLSLIEIGPGTLLRALNK